MVEFVKYERSLSSFNDYAYASPFWSKVVCKSENDTLEAQLKPSCGRACNLAFNYATNKLYIADDYYGLGVVGPDGGQAIQLANSADGIDFKWLYALTVDQRTGVIYFTDVSTI
ncbi:hypothetical protein ACH5RR_000779 [Cinchona calisaya]|uniref:Uncharacterized protein n=1 Tax=Cinchona calisaya TaxID=153742 RepID=A0ABD3B1N4_9GENT